MDLSEEDNVLARGRNRVTQGVILVIYLSIYLPKMVRKRDNVADLTAGEYAE